MTQRLEDIFEITDDDELPANIEYVPHKNGKIRGDKLVVMSFRVTAKERYTWSLAALERGLTLTDVVRRAFNELLEREENGDRRR